MAKPKIPESIKADATELAEQLLKTIGKRKNSVAMAALYLAMLAVEQTQSKYTEPSNAKLADTTHPPP